MRVLEDIARFALNHQGLSARWKSLRHEFRAALDQLPPGWQEANRDVPGDVGTTVTTPTETQRADLLEVAIAAGKRLTESLRVIEETLKTINPPVAGEIERAQQWAAQIHSLFNQTAQPT